MSLQPTLANHTVRHPRQRRSALIASALLAAASRMRSGGYVLQDYDGREGDMHAHFCLRGANDDLRNRLTRRFGQLFSAVDCSWNDGGVILSRNGEKAMFIDVNVDCSGNRGFCAGFCGATYGNLGAEHGAYRLPPAQQRRWMGHRKAGPERVS